MNYNQVQKLLKAVNLENEYQKGRAMIYDVESKEDCAEFCGLDYYVFYALSYQDWKSISDKITQFQREAFDLYSSSGIPRFIPNDHTTMKDIWCAYLSYKRGIFERTVIDEIFQQFS